MIIRLLTILLVASVCWVTIPAAQSTKVVYFAPIDGAGTDANPYRARCEGMPGAGSIDLRPHGINAFLCGSETLPKDTTGIVQLGASLSSNLNSAKLSEVEQFTGKTLSSTTVQNAITELVKGRIVPSKDGKLKIYLGGLIPVYEQTAWVPFEDGGLVADAVNLAATLLEPSLVWATTLATETWTGCGDSSTLTCVLNWTEFQGTAWAIVSNQASVSGQTGTNQQEARADHTLASDAHWAQAKLISATSDNSGTVRCGPLARKANNATRDFYAFVANQVNNVFTQYETFKRVGGSFTSIASDPTDPVTSEVMRVYVDGSSVSGYVNGVLRVGPTTDTSITTNTYAGITYSANNNTTQSCVIDDFSAADITAFSGAYGRRNS